MGPRPTQGKVTQNDLEKERARSEAYARRIKQRNLDESYKLNETLAELGPSDLQSRLALYRQFQKDIERINGVD